MDLEVGENKAQVVVRENAYREQKEGGVLYGEGS